MPRISFTKKFPSFDVKKNANLMKSLLVSGRPVASSCDGDGICARCRIKIVDGEENLSEASFFEVERMEMNNIPLGYRLSCQSRILGDITVDADYW